MESAQAVKLWRSAGAAFAQRYPPIAAAFTTRLRLTLIAGAGLGVAIYIATFVYALLTADNLVTIHGPIVGGDFVVFWTAARETLSGDPVALYQPAAIEAALAARFEGQEDFRLLWLYPPAMFLFVAPLGLLPYLPAYFVWAGASLAMLGALLWSQWRNRLAVFFALSSLAAFQGWITGQTGFLTATLLGVAATQARRRPVLAGLAAGLLTVKPQFGLLIPLAFIAAGCWRAFVAAALASLAVLALGAAFFGAEGYAAFFDAGLAHGAWMQNASKYFAKLISPFGAASLAGAPYQIAITLHLAVALSMAAFVAIIWRRTAAFDLRAMALLAAAPFASPYALYYELPIFIPAVFLLARRGAGEGWLSGERPALAALWIAPLFLPGSGDIPATSLSFLIAAGAFLLVARRVCRAAFPQSAAP